MESEKFMEEKYGLSKNPFLDDIARETWLGTWVNREEQLVEWKKVIDNAPKSTKNYIVFIIGNYGRGKTLSLLKIIDEAKGNSSILTRYLTFKGEEKPRNPGLDFIFRIFKSINFKDIISTKNENSIKKAIESLPNDFEEVRNVLWSVYFGDNDEPNLALYFLRGEIRPTSAQLKKLKVIRKIEDIDIAKEYLAGVLRFVKALGFSTLLLAIDEFEYLFSLIPKTQQGIYLALLRGLYDFSLERKALEDITNMSLFLAISEDGWRNLKELEKKEESSGGPIQPLLDRVDAETVLPAFDKGQTKALIEKRLSYNRIEGKYENKPLIPFTEDFVKIIYELTNGEPRAIIVRCGQVLDAGLEKSVTLLDRKFAEKSLKERGLL